MISRGVSKIKIYINNIIAPNLLGIDRKIKQAKRKYHSGLIADGVIIGFAILKLSGSLNKY